ncbi:MAG TPA: hypothetical protein VJR27_05015 [Candidatus Saccharimonadales bacterium]|nr:hypothetical protein [Candidatus Saccharimonadales bacterium]
MDHMASAAVNCIGDTTCDSGLPNIAANNGNVQVVLQIVFGVIGALAVIIIIISALRLASSQGNPQEASKARQGIVYSAIGLVLALSAEIIVTYVLGAI